MWFSLNDSLIDLNFELMTTFRSLFFSYYEDVDNRNEILYSSKQTSKRSIM